MTKRKHFLASFSVGMMLFAFQGGTASRASETIRNIPPTAHGAPPGTTRAQLTAAIEQAADDLDWQTVEEGPGRLVATLLVRGKHEAIVTIGFDPTNYWIDYRDSTNLDYDPDDLVRRSRTGSNKTRVIVGKGPRIHKNYNVWVERLAQRIAVRAKLPPKASAPGSSPLLVADELQKLDILRRRGVLTQQEFDRQKAKLLSQ